MGEFVYLDWAATAPLCTEACEAMQPFLAPGVAQLSQGGGNANSLYTVGRTAFKELEDARRRIARCINARPDEIIFTSGATEADNAALFGIIAAKRAEFQRKGQDRTAKLVTTAIEHDAVLNAAKALARKGVEVAYVKPDAGGHVTVDALREAMGDDTTLVSVMSVNNEIGSVMDIAAMVKAAHAAGALFHCDATQALGKVPVDVRAWGVDALSISSHKVGGPKGVGVLYLKARTPFEAQLLGGGQETGRRSGTQNVAGAVGFAAAAERAVEMQPAEEKRLSELRDYAYERLSAIPRVEPMIAAPSGAYACHIASFAVAGMESETLILQLDNRGICVSGGSACSSHSLDPSHVLSAMGIARDRALSGLRVSMGDETTREDIDALADALAEVLA